MKMKIVMGLVVISAMLVGFADLVPMDSPGGRRGSRGGVRGGAQGMCQRCGGTGVVPSGFLGWSSKPCPECQGGRGGGRRGGGQGGHNGGSAARPQGGSQSGGHNGGSAARPQGGQQGRGRQQGGQQGRPGNPGEGTPR